MLMVMLMLMLLADARQPTSARSPPPWRRLWLRPKRSRAIGKLGFGPDAAAKATGRA